MASWISGKVTTSRAASAAVDARSVPGRRRGIGLEADREGIGAEHPEAVDGIVPADEHRLAAAAGQRSFGDPDDAQRQDGAVDRGDIHGLVEGEAQASGQTLRHDGRAAFVQGREGRSPVARQEDEPSVRGQVGARHGRAIRSVGPHGDVERPDLGHTGHARRLGEGRRHTLVGGDGPDRGRDDVTRDDVGDPGAGGDPCVLADRTEGHDGRKPDRERPDGQDRAAPVTGQRPTGQALLEAEQQRERRTSEATEWPQDERQQERRGEQDRVHGERPADTGVTDPTRPDEQAGDGHRDEDDDQPAQAGAPGGGAFGSAPQGLDRRDAAGPTRRPQGGRQGHRDPDDERRDDGRDRHLGGIDGHVTDRPDPGDHHRREHRSEDDAQERTRRCRAGAPVAARIR